MLASLERARIGALLLLTSPYVPLLFQGEEWAAATPFQYFTDHDAELGAQVSAGRRREFAAFGWDAASIPDPQDPGTFARSKLRWDELGREPHSTMLAWYRALVTLRREIPSLGEGRYAESEVSADDTRSLLVVRRRNVLIACNFSKEPQAVPLEGMTALRLASTAGVRVDGGDLLLPPEAAAIVT
jgi:maltooligosyltrehalose trehalohydrolase